MSLGLLRFGHGPGVWPEYGFGNCLENIKGLISILEANTDLFATGDTEASTKAGLANPGPNMSSTSFCMACELRMVFHF